MSDSDRLREATDLLRGLMAWAPDDLDDKPSEWQDAQRFLEENEAREIKGA
jgi:hypothetical protein